MKSFNKAANALTVVNVKTNRHLMPEIYHLLEQKYPEYRDENKPEMLENLTEQLGRKGFLYALKDSSNGAIKGFSAGVTYESDTAAISYIVTPRNDQKAAEKLRDETLGKLAKERGVKAVFVEIFDDSHKENVKRNKAEEKLYADLGAVKAPVSYAQPLWPDDDTAVPNMHLHVLFTAPMTAAAKSDITLAHLTAFTVVYDPQLDNPKNVQQLVGYKHDLNNATWGMKQDAPALKR